MEVVWKMNTRLLKKYNFIIINNKMIAIFILACFAIIGLVITLAPKSKDGESNWRKIFSNDRDIAPFDAPGFCRSVNVGNCRVDKTIPMEDNQKESICPDYMECMSPISEGSNLGTCRRPCSKQNPCRDGYSCTDHYCTKTSTDPEVCRKNLILGNSNCPFGDKCMRPSDEGCTWKTCQIDFDGNQLYERDIYCKCKDLQASNCPDKDMLIDTRTGKCLCGDKKNTMVCP